MLKALEKAFAEPAEVKDSWEDFSSDDSEDKARKAAEAEERLARRIEKRKKRAELLDEVSRTRRGLNVATDTRAGHVPDILDRQTAHPQPTGGRVFVAGGGAGESLLAFDAANGELLWKTGDEMMTHATPVAATSLDSLRK